MWTLGALDAAARCSLKSFSHVRTAYCISDYEGVRMTLRSSVATAHLEGVLLDEELEALDAVGGLHGAPGGSGGTVSCEHSQPDPTRDNAPCNDTSHYCNTIWDANLKFLKLTQNLGQLG
jgi:hypothetical protein